MIGIKSAALALTLCFAAGTVYAQSDRPAARTGGTAIAEASSPLNLNTASQAQLEALPGIGPSTAMRILEYRQKNGGFKKVEDLMNVRGVGEKSFLKLKPLITVSTPRTAQ